MCVESSCVRIVALVVLCIVCDVVVTRCGESRWIGSGLSCGVSCIEWSTASVSSCRIGCCWLVAVAAKVLLWPSRTVQRRSHHITEKSQIRVGANTAHSHLDTTTATTSNPHNSLATQPDTLSIPNTRPASYLKPPFVTCVLHSPSTPPASSRPLYSQPSRPFPLHSSLSLCHRLATFLSRNHYAVSCCSFYTHSDL